MSYRDTFQPGDALRQTLSGLTSNVGRLRERMNWPSVVLSGPSTDHAPDYANFVQLFNPPVYATLSTIDLDPGRWILIAKVDYRVATSSGYRCDGGLKISAAGEERTVDVSRTEITSGSSVDLRYSSRIALEVVGTDRFTATLSMWGGARWTVAPPYLGRFFEASGISFLAFPG